MSVRVWIGHKEVFRKPAGLSAIKVESGWSNNEATVSLTAQIGGVERIVRIGGAELVRMLEVLALDPRYRVVFSEPFKESAKLS